MSGSRYVVVCMLVLAVGLGVSSPQASAQSSFGLGPYYFSNNAVSDVVGTGLSMTYRHRAKNNVSLEDCFVYSKSSGEIDGTMVHGEAYFGTMMVNLQPEMSLNKKGTSKAYVGIGAGHAKGNVYFESDTGSSVDHPTAFAWQAFAGVSLGRHLFAEGKYFNAGQDGLLNGSSLSLGMRF